MLLKKVTSKKRKMKLCIEYKKRESVKISEN